MAGKTAVGKMVRPAKGRTVGRLREKEPDRTKPEGQLSLYLAHLLRARDKTPDDLAEAIGVQRSTVFNWLRGDSAPPVKLWAPIAKALGLKDWRALVPPQRFIDKLA